MIVPPCAAPGCSKPVKRNMYARSLLGRYCSTHQQRLRFRGTLNPPRIGRILFHDYLGRITRTVERGDGAKITEGLRVTAGLLVDAARDLEDASHSGRWVRQWSVRASQETYRVLDNLGSVRSGLVASAVFLIREEEPHQFDCEDAFRFELVRLWRSETNLATGTTWDAKSGTRKLWYRPLPPRSTKAVAALLVNTYGPVAAQIIRAYKEMRSRPAVARQALAEGLSFALPSQ